MAIIHFDNKRTFQQYTSTAETCAWVKKKSSNHQTCLTKLTCQLMSSYPKPLFVSPHLHISRDPPHSDWIKPWISCQLVFAIFTQMKGIKSITYILCKQLFNRHFPPLSQFYSSNESKMTCTSSTKSRSRRSTCASITCVEANSLERRHSNTAPSLKTIGINHLPGHQSHKGRRVEVKMSYEELFILCHCCFHVQEEGLHPCPSIHGSSVIPNASISSPFSKETPQGIALGKVSQQYSNSAPPHRLPNVQTLYLETGSCQLQLY